jgi:hypothetical protein
MMTNYAASDYKTLVLEGVPLRGRVRLHEDRDPDDHEWRTARGVINANIIAGSIDMTQHLLGAGDASP